MSDPMLTPEQIASFAGYGSLAHRAEEDAEREHNRQIHLAAVRTGYTGDDDAASDRERVAAIGGRLTGTTPITSWERMEAGNEQSLRVRPGGDPDVAEDYDEQLDDTTEEEARRWGPAETVAKVHTAPQLPAGWPNHHRIA